MRLLLPCLLTLSITTTAPAQQPKKPSPHIADTDPLPPEQQQKKFHLPPGFEIQLVAAEPDINKPININFDAKGRLWVTGSTEYPYAAKAFAGKDKVWILDDFAPNGRAKKISVFADDLNIPIGVLPLTPSAKDKGASALVYSIPNIYRLSDTTGNGKCDKKEILFSGFGYKDTHGMTGEFTWGFDGWVYACHGFANTSKVKDKTGQVKIEMQSGNVYRFKPDGSKIEYFTHGQVNPFGLAFDPLGNLYSCDCHSRPIYQLLKGAWYPSFQKPHDGLGFGPEMMTHSHGSTAIGGIAYYAADHFPAEYRDNIFIGNVVTNRINRDRLEWTGATPKAIEMPDLVKCDDPWFRPVDIKLGPDGALYVADFYNRIIGHYEVPLDHPGRDREKGRIWRIVYKGKDGKNRLPPLEDLTRLTDIRLWEKFLSDNLSLRITATNQIVEKMNKEVQEMHEGFLRKSDLSERVHSLWILERAGVLQGKDLTLAANSDDPILRVHAMRILAERASWDEFDRKLVLNRGRDKEAIVRRAAAEAMANHPHHDHIEPLLGFRSEILSSDTHLLHTVRTAPRDQLKTRDVWLRMPMRLAERESAAMMDVCLAIPSAESAIFILRHLERNWENKANLSRFSHHIARYGTEKSIQELMAMLTRKSRPDASIQAAAYRAIHQGVQERGGTLAKELSKQFENITRWSLESKKDADIQLGIELAAALKATHVSKELLAIADNINANEQHRKSAIAALAVIEPDKNVALFSKLLADNAEPFGVREQAAQALGGHKSPQAHDHLLKALATASARLEKPIAMSLASSKPGAEKLLDAVAAGKASPRLLQDQPLADRLRQAKVSAIDARLKKLTAGLPPADASLFKLLAQRRDGYVKAKADVAVGAKVFAKNCANCHQVNNEGSKIGPQLDGIGIRGLDRILEDILDPHRNVDQAFRATTLTLKNGQLVTGLLLKQEGKVLIMADNLGKEQRYELDAVESRALSPLSPMPSTFAEAMAADEFNHLLAFLLAQTVQRK